MGRPLSGMWALCPPCLTPQGRREDLRVLASDPHHSAMSHPLPLSALRAFEAAARTGSFRAAADDLGLTPSAVSHAIRGLEQALGTTLFLRTGRSIRLTDGGRTLMRHVERGFGDR